MMKALSNNFAYHHIITLFTHLPMHTYNFIPTWGKEERPAVSISILCQVSAKDITQSDEFS